MLNEVSKFRWQPQPDVSKWLNGLLFEFCNANPDIAWLADRMRADTGTRLVDWVDFVGLMPSGRERERLSELGFVPDATIEAGDEGAEVLVHPDGLFPMVLLLAETSQHQRSPRLMPMLRVGVRVDSVRDFLEANRLACLELAEGEVDGQIRQACISNIGAVALWVVERHGYRGFSSPRNGTESVAAGVHHLRAFRERARDLESESLSFDRAEELIRAAVADLGEDWACDLFFQAEREYWLSRNKAARVQYERQSKFGFGWAFVVWSCWVANVANAFMPASRRVGVRKSSSNKMHELSSLRTWIYRRAKSKATLLTFLCNHEPSVERWVRGASCMAKRFSKPACITWNVSSILKRLANNWRRLESRRWRRLRTSLIYGRPSPSGKYGRFRRNV